MKKASVIIIGGGGRGTIYARHLRELADRVEVVGIAEPRDFFRNRIAAMHRIPPENICSDWHELAARPKFADAVIITTQDRMHLEPAVAFANKKYDILIEKPLAPDLEGCRDLIAAAERNNIILSVCHVLRYTNFTRTLKGLIDEGKIGKVMSVQHLEPVGHWRFAHSYVRGNWRKEEESSSVLLAKSIHDLDWICYIVNSMPERVSSFGSLMFFKKENQPKGAADRCLDCKIEADCPYSAPRFYLDASVREISERMWNRWSERQRRRICSRVSARGPTADASLPATTTLPITRWSISNLKMEQPPFSRLPDVPNTGIAGRRFSVRLENCSEMGKSSSTIPI